MTITIEQLQLILMGLTIFCFSMLALAFILRIIRIVKTMELRDSEDVVCLVFILTIYSIVLYCWFYLKKKFTKHDTKTS